MAKMRDYFQYNSYFSLLFKTKKYRELFYGHVAVISLMISLVLICIIAILYYNIAPEKISVVLGTVLLTAAAGLIGLLGFLITGVSLLAVLMTEKSLEALERKGIVESLVGVLFSFYFAGSVIGITIFMCIANYLILQFEMNFNSCGFFVMLILNTYFCAYSIMYSVALLGSCINAFFTNIYLSKKWEIQDDETS